MTAIAYMLQLLNALPALIQAGHDVSDLITHTRDRLQDMQTTGRDPTQAEWDELDARIKDLRGRLHSDDS